jgi:hypothetical protein
MEDCIARILSASQLPGVSKHEPVPVLPRSAIIILPLANSNDDLDELFKKTETSLLFGLAYYDTLVGQNTLE